MRLTDLFEARYPLAGTGEWYGNLDYKARGGRLIYMTPDQYLSQVRPLDIDESSRDNIDDLKRHIQSGRTLDPLAIYEDGKEDGRHRAHAAKELGIRRVPVIDFRKLTEAVKSVNEAAEDDINSVGLAQEWAYKFTNWLEQHNTSTPLGEIDDFLYWQAPAHGGVEIDMLYLSGWRLGLPNDLSFAIGWTRDGSETSVRGYLMQGLMENRRHYYVVLMAQSDPRQEKEVIWQLNVNSLAHEITHYFDYKRGMAGAFQKQRMQQARTGRKADTKRPQDDGPAKYYNDPLEFNAHFQQAMASIFTSLSSVIAQKAVYGEPAPLKWLNSFATFYQHFRKTADQQKDQFLENLNLKNKRKIISRLYKLYVLIKQQWPNIPAVQRQAADFIARWTAQDKQEEVTAQ